MLPRKGKEAVADRPMNWLLAHTADRFVHAQAKRVCVQSAINQSCITIDNLTHAHTCTRANAHMRMLA